MFDIWFWFISGGSDCILEMQKKANCRILRLEIWLICAAF